MRLRDKVIEGKPSTAFRRMLEEGPLPVVGIWGGTAHHAQLARLGQLVGRLGVDDLRLRVGEQPLGQPNLA